MIKFKNKIFLANFLILLFLFSFKTGLAQTSIPEKIEKSDETNIVIDGKDVSEATSTSTEAIKELILKKVTEQSESSTSLDSLNSWRKAVIGEVEKITDDSISVATKFGTLVIATNKELSFKKDDKEIAAKNVEIGNWLLIIGTTKVSEKKQTDLLISLQPQIIYVYDKSLKIQEPFVEIGTIKNFAKTSLDLVSRKSKDTLSINIKQAKYQDINGQTVKPSQLEQDMAILVVGFKELNNLTASTIVSLAEEINSPDAKP